MDRQQAALRHPDLDDPLLRRLSPLGRWAVERPKSLEDWVNRTADWSVSEAFHGATIRYVRKGRPAMRRIA